MASEHMNDADRTKALNAIKENRLVISEEGLKRIAEHKYVGGTYTPMDNLCSKHLWTPMLELLPKGLAPNAVTVSGLVLQICGFLAVNWYCPDFKTPAPRWVYVLASFTVWAYQTLDALDGKQARRTGSSSPLGQLFDHGCDSVVTVFMAMLSAMCLQLGFSTRCVTFVMFMLLPFWMCQWCEYHAHVLPTNIAGILGVTEAQILCMLLVLVPAISPSFWETETGLGQLPPWWCGQNACPVALNDCFVASQLLCGLCGIIQCFHSVLNTCSGKVEALLQTVPVLMIFIIGYVWCLLIPQAHPRLVLFSLGMTFSYLTCKMIVAAMSRMPYPVFQPIVLPLLMVFVVAKLDLMPRHSDVLLGAYSAIVIWVMAQWVRRVIEEISQYLGIRTFRLGPRPKIS